MSSNTPLLDSIVASCKSKNNTKDATVFLSIASKNCTNLSQLDRIAYLQSEVKDYSGCIDSLKICLLLADSEQSKFAIRANAAKMYNHLNEPMMSLAYSKINKESYFDYDTLMEMSFSYYLMGNYAESEKMMRELVTHQDLPEEVRGRVEYNLGSYDIERGDFKKGLKGFIDIGHKIKIWYERYIPNIPVWKGEDIQGKILVIHAEGGIGDELINVRFVNNLKALGVNPVWVSNHQDLVSVFNRNGILSTQDITSIDTSNTLQCMAMYLPILLDLDKEQLWKGPYLKPSKGHLDKWMKILPEGKKLAVKWSGNPFYDQDLHRSIPLDVINHIPYNGTKINLQMELDLHQPDMFNVGHYINSIEDTLAILWLCDDLITSCTSIAHMCGALGKNGNVCPPIASYYIWLGAEGYSDWYDKSLKVFRQKTHKNWDFIKAITLK